MVISISSYQKDRRDPCRAALIIQAALFFNGMPAALTRSIYRITIYLKVNRNHIQNFEH